MNQAWRSISRRVGGPAIGGSLLLCWMAGAALGQNSRKCPVESGDASEIADAVRAAPSCAQSYEVMNVCRAGAGAEGDLALANIVVEKCEQVFVATLDAVTLKSYSAARDNCARRFVKKDANSLSNQAACEAGVAVVFAHRADLEAMRAQRAANRPRPAGQAAPPAPAAEIPEPFGGLPPK
jgi:hypothetical protein